MFHSCRKVFNGRGIKQRKKHGEICKNKSDPLTCDEEQLWKLKILGSNNFKSLNYNIFYIL